MHNFPWRSKQVRFPCTVEFNRMKKLERYMQGQCTHLFLHRLVCIYYCHIYFFRWRSLFHLLDVVLFFLLFHFFDCNLGKNAKCSTWNFNYIHVIFYRSEYFLVPYLHYFFTSNVQNTYIYTYLYIYMTTPLTRFSGPV